MSQNSIQPSGAGSGSSFSAATRNALDSVATMFSGASAPSASGQPFAHQLWLDTSAGLLKKRNSTNTAWVAIAGMDQFLGNALDQALQIEVLSTALTQATIAYTALSVQGAFVTSGSLTLSTGGTVGTANSLDTGVWAINTWYATYVICSDDASLVACLASTSSSSPTLPTGYTKFRRIGWLRSTGTATNLWPTAQRNGDAMWTSADSDHTAFAAANPPSSFTDVDCSAMVPPGVRRARVSATLTTRIASYSGPAGTGQFYALQRKGVGNSTLFAAVVGAGQTQINHGLIEVDSSRFLQHRIQLTSAVVADFTVTLYVLGWIDDGAV